MRIGVLRTQVPFVTGGAERHAANLVAALKARGFEATEITLPFKWYPGEVLADHILAARMIDVSEVEGVPIDLTIGLKFPAYLARHPNRVFWIIHQYRQAYDQWDSGTSDLLETPQGEALRALVHEEDRRAFEASPHPIYANSCNVAGRLEKHLGITAQPLYHPPPNATALRQGRSGDYLFLPGRVHPSKRLELSLQALAAAPASRLVVAGTADNPAYQNHLTQMASDLGVSKRVKWLGAVDDATLIRHYAEARGVVFVPQDEDYGYITLEAMLSGKPVVTVTDAGGPLEFITDGVEGVIAAPEAKALGAAFDQISGDSGAAERMGQAGLSRYRSLNISWDHVVKTLTRQVSVAVLPDTARLTAPATLRTDRVDETLQSYDLDALIATAEAPLNPSAKPRVHWISPLPPAQTDIAHYTRRILPELAETTDLVLWTDAPRWDRGLYDICPVRWLDPDHVTPGDFARAGRPVGDSARGPQAVFVNIGNAVDFHAGFLRLIQRMPSVVVLHDMAIQDLCFNAIRDGAFSREVYEKNMAYWHGADGLAAAKEVFAGQREMGNLADEIPGFEIALRRAVSVLTHTPVVQEAVEATETVPAYLADLPFQPSATPPPTARSKIGPLRLVQFGYIGTNRRIHKILEALAPLRGEVDFHLDIMGQLWDPAYLHLRIRELGLRHCVTIHGFVDEAELDRHLRAAHLVFNLRNPTMGEASGSQMRIWNAAAPSVVTDLGWYADLPDDTVFKIDPEDEVPAVQRLIRQLAADPAAGRAVAAAGRARLEAAHTPGLYAQRIAEVARRFEVDAAAALRKRRLQQHDPRGWKAQHM